MNDDIEELSRFAAEQRFEFMPAGAIESDMELAYRLQMEEAMAASLAFQPSSSNSSSQSPKPTSSISIDKFETGIKDRMIIETETKKQQVEIDRLIHDQKLAREIFEMPDEQWQEVGNNFNRPFCEGSSSSSSKIEDSSEVFRVYFKGLLSEERVNGASSSNQLVTMAAIGVAVCDSIDNIIVEIKKPLDLIKGDRMSKQSVELQALIEVLNAAASKKLQRIVLYCDYYPLCQYVSGRWRPKQQKIITILEQVNLLRKSFKFCELSFIARKDVKFAFKLAREAINSQISKVVSSLEKLENCVICLDDKPKDTFFIIEDCTHRYCRSCMTQHIEVNLLNGVFPKCPHEGCKNNLRVESCKTFLKPKFTDMMEQRLKEDSIPVAEKLYCPYPKCSTLMSRNDIIKFPLLVYGYGARSCYKCHGIFCISCKVPWHENMNCSEYKRRNPTQLVEESKLKNLAERNLWRQCVKCKHMIELATGCCHMTCWYIML